MRHSPQIWLNTPRIAVPKALIAIVVVAIKVRPTMPDDNTFRIRCRTRCPVRIGFVGWLFLLVSAFLLSIGPFPVFAIEAVQPPICFRSGCWGSVENSLAPVRPLGRSKTPLLPQTIGLLLNNKLGSASTDILHVCEVSLPAFPLGASRSSWWELRRC